jgi:hypothetical protein
LGPPGPHTGRAGHRPGHQARLDGGADLNDVRPPAAADLPYPPRPWLRQRAGRKGFTETDYARLLDAAHQQLGGPIVLIWDHLNTHVSRAMHELIAARLWLTVYQLPPYAPELNPVEGVWSHLKGALANLTKHSLDQLTELAKTRLKRMQ